MKAYTLEELHKHSEDKSLSMGPDPEELVPIELQISTGRERAMLDIFTWNISEAKMSPSEYAHELCKDLDLSSHMETDIADQFTTQIDIYKDFLPMIKPAKADNIQKIYLDITINNLNLKDCFDWDLTNTDSNPEEFAKSLCTELALPLEFEPAIASSIRTQIYTYKKMEAHGTTVQPVEVLDKFGSIVRGDEELAKNTPQVGILNTKKTESKAREARYIRRHGTTSLPSFGRGRPSPLDTPLVPAVAPLVPDTVVTSSRKRSRIADTDRQCTKCGTTKTPLWRSGPSGPKTLCNACGLKLSRERSKQSRSK